MTVCTACGGFWKLLTSLMSSLLRALRALIASSSAGKA